MTQHILNNSWQGVPVSAPFAVTLTLKPDTMFTNLRTKTFDVKSSPNPWTKLISTLNSLKSSCRRLRSDAKQVPKLSNEMCTPRLQNLNVEFNIKFALKQVFDVAHHLNCQALHEVTLKAHLIRFWNSAGKWVPNLGWYQRLKSNNLAI